MKSLAKVLSVIGVLVILGALIWHIVMGLSVGNPLTPTNSSPSNVAVFGNSLLLISILLFGCKK